MVSFVNLDLSSFNQGSPCETDTVTRWRLLGALSGYSVPLATCNWSSSPTGNLESALGFIQVRKEPSGENVEIVARFTYYYFTYPPEGSNCIFFPTTYIFPKTKLTFGKRGFSQRLESTSYHSSHLRLPQNKHIHVLNQILTLDIFSALLQRHYTHTVP